MENVKMEKKLKERRFYVALPLLVLPFVTWFFAALGGGEGKRHLRDNKEHVERVNTSLPEANADDDGKFDKMAFYNQAMNDSVEYQRSRDNDPYLLDGPAAVPDSGGLPYPAGEFRASPYSGGGYNGTRDRDVVLKLQQLQESLRNPEPYAGTPDDDMSHPEPVSATGVNSGDIDRLEGMMNSVQQSGSEDTEMNQLSGMLESILDIQHPDRVTARLKQKSEERQGEVFPVSPAKEQLTVSVLDTQQVSVNGLSSGFFGFPAVQDEHAAVNAIQAVIHETQRITNGSIVKLRLLNDIYINGQLIPKDAFVHGIAQINGERVNIQIPGVRYKNAIFPVRLTVFDLDGLAGVYVPGTISGDVARESGDRTLESLGLTTFSQSLGAQAMSAGIEAGKSFLSRKVKLIKVTLKAGYKVLLVDEKRQK